MPDGSRSFDSASSPDLDRVAQLFREHLAFVWRVLRRCGVPSSELDDAVQETFLVVHRRIGDFEGRASERTWLYAVAVRVASTLRRSASRERGRRERAGERMHGSSEADPEDEVARSEATRILDRLLDELDQPKRDVFVLAELEGVKVPEIARILDVNVRTVHSRLRLARERFSSALARHHAREQGRMQRASLRTLRQAGVDERPTERCASAAWAGLALRISEGASPIPIVWTGAAVASLAKGSTFLIPFAATLAVGVVGITAAVVGFEPEPPELVSTELIAPVSPPRAEPAGTTIAPTSQPVSAGHDAAEATAAAAALAPRAPALTTVAAVPPTKARRQVAPQSAPAESAAPATLPDRLLAETTLLAKARAALKAGHNEIALGHLNAHAKAFPNGTLSGERDSSRIKALCNAGRHSEARAFSEGRGDNLASVFRAHCGSPPRGGGQGSPL